MTIRTYLSVPILLLAALLQVTLMPHLAVAHVQPDLVLALTICWGLLYGATGGAIAGLAGGFALDLMSGAPFGMHTFVLTLIGSLAGLGVAMIPPDHWLLVPGAAVLCTIIQQGAYVSLLRMAGWPLSWSQVLPEVVIPAALLNLLLTVLLYPLVGMLHRQVAPEEIGW